MCGKIYWKLYTVLSYRGVVYLLYIYFKISCVLLLVVLFVLL